MITLHLLGTIALRDAGQRDVTVVLAQPKRLALLAYLAAASDGPHRRDTLLGLFWPGLDSEHARNALSKALHFLREALGADVIVARNSDELALDPTQIRTDVGAFEEAMAAERYDEALRLYRGDLLPAVFVDDAAPFEHWLEEARTRFRSRAVRAARLEAERQEREKHYTQAIDVARRGVDLSHDDERTLRRLLALLTRLGDHAGALSAYERFARRLAEDLGATPSPETLALVEEIRSGRTPPPVASPPPPSPAGSGAARQLDIALGDRYRVLHEIGSGSTARVYLADDRKLHRRVAIKVLRPTLAELSHRAKFDAEIVVAAGLNHPHVVPLLDAGEAAGLLYYVMPFVAGETLRERLVRAGRLPVAEALLIAREVADALSYAHARGFVHRDVKPENILLADGHALLTDFGIARALTDEPLDHERKGWSGTPAYASPERGDGTSPEDGRADLYSLGCVLYEMLAGRPPFVADTVPALLDQHRDVPPPPITQFRPDVPPIVATIISAALAKHPDHRPADAAEVLGVLRTAQDGGVGSGRLRRRRALTTLGLALLVGGLGWWKFVRSVSAPEDRPQLLLASVDAGHDTVMGQGIAAFLMTDLLGSTAYRLVPVQLVRAAQRRMNRAPDAFLGDSAAHDLAVREGIPLVAVVTVRPLERQYVLTATVSTSEDSVLGSGSAVADSLSVTTALDTISRSIRRWAGEGSRSVARRPPLQQVTTASLPALRLYSASMAPTAGSSPLPGTIRLLEEAVSVDTTFAMAYRRLSGQYWLIRRFTEGRKALHLAERYRDHLTPVEQLFVDADIAMQVRFDTAARRQAHDRILALDPDNWVALIARATYEVQWQRPIFALPYIARAMQIDSGGAASRDLLFDVRLMAGDTARAREAIEPWIALPRYVTGVPSYLSLLAWRTGELSYYRRRVDSVIAAHPPNPGEFDEVGRIQATMTFLAGRHNEGTRLWDAHAATQEPERAVQVLASTPFRRAQCDALLGADLTATKAYLANAESSFPLRSLPPDERAGTVMYLAGAWAYIGEPAKARALLERWWPRTTELAPFVIATRWMMEAHILEAEGDDDGVITLGRAHLHSPIMRQLALPMSWAFQRKQMPDSAIYYGELFATRFTYPFLTADWSCAEQELHRRVGLLYWERGDRDNALRHLRRYVTMWSDPDPGLRSHTAEVAALIGHIDRSTLPRLE